MKSTIKNTYVIARAAEKKETFSRPEFFPPTERICKKLVQEAKKTVNATK